MKGVLKMTRLFYINRKDANGRENGSGQFVQFENPNRRNKMIQGEIKRDYRETGDGIFWMMQRTCILTAETTQRDRLINEMYNRGAVLYDGEIVTIVSIIEEGEAIKVESEKQYQFKVLGDFSDCGIFKEI